MFYLQISAETILIKSTPGANLPIAALIATTLAL
jgi:hypothetical protein